MIIKFHYVRLFGTVRLLGTPEYLRSKKLSATKLFYNDEVLQFQGRNKATSSQGVLNTYDFLFDRHLRMLTNMESDQDINEEEVKTLHSINQPLETNVEEVTEDSSMDESDELSILGEDLVNRSLAEVTSLLDQQIDLNSESNKKPLQQPSSAPTKRISFLVPSDVPRISISSASIASVDEE